MGRGTTRISVAPEWCCGCRRLQTAALHPHALFHCSRSNPEEITVARSIHYMQANSLRVEKRLTRTVVSALKQKAAPKQCDYLPACGAIAPRNSASKISSSCRYIAEYLPGLVSGLNDGPPCRKIMPFLVAGLNTNAEVKPHASPK
jgi:hypothetical protein